MERQVDLAEGGKEESEVADERSRFLRKGKPPESRGKLYSLYSLGAREKQFVG